MPEFRLRGSNSASHDATQVTTVTVPEGYTLHDSSGHDYSPNISAPETGSLATLLFAGLALVLLKGKLEIKNEELTI